jgi:hydroxyethylthiazole kinase-like uncharacterized protein yjeF
MPSTHALYSTAEIRKIEQAALAALPAGTLMERAAQAAAAIARSLLPPANEQVLLIAGPGNNGGDALVTASLLAEAGVEPTVMLCADIAHQPEDSRRALERAKSANVRIVEPSLEAIAQPWNLIVDGLFGIGLARPISGALRDLVQALNQQTCPILALDIPSGLNADTGCIVGEDGTAVKATHTVTFIADKSGLHTGDGRDYAGQVQVADLDIERTYFVAATAQLSDIALFAPSLKRRRHSSHKGSYGDVIVVGGAHGMAGAPVLASRAAAKCGAGRVFTAFLEEAPAYDSVQPELMCRLASDMNFASGTLVVGPGLGNEGLAHDLLAKALHAPSPLVLDADALNLITAEPGLQQILSQRRSPSLMTPHPLEAARLLQVTTHEIQGDRLAAARRLARQFNAIVVLKGSGSVIAKPDGEIAINPTGNPGLATAGTGDVLAGMCGALLAQSFTPWHAAIAAVWIHGQAADMLVSQGIGPIGMTAGELIPCARAILNQLTEQHAQHHLAS